MNYNVNTYLWIVTLGKMPCTTGLGLYSNLNSVSFSGTSGSTQEIMTSWETFTLISFGIDCITQTTLVSFLSKANWEMSAMWLQRLKLFCAHYQSSTIKSHMKVNRHPSPATRIWNSPWRWRLSPWSVTIVPLKKTKEQSTTDTV